MKFWVYLNGEVPGCFIPADLAKLEGFSGTTLVCPAEGEVLEKNWQRAGEFPDLHVTIGDPYLESHGMEAPADSAIVRMAEEAVRRIDGGHPIRGVPYCTDAACLAAVGIPYVVLGPGYIEQAHTETEYVDVQQVVKAAAIYRELMLGV